MPLPFVAVLAATDDTAQKVVADTVDRYYVPVRSRQAVAITPPFGGGGGPWVAVNGPSNTSGHRRTAIQIGRAHV